jgi:hypothetical protein
MAVAEDTVTESSDSRSAAAFKITRPQRHCRKVFAEWQESEKELCQCGIDAWT